jgi:Sensors of blue-light using FAD
MQRIIYLSTETGCLTENQLNDLLITSRNFNKLNNITGVLLHIDGDFLQVIEGQKEKIFLLYEKIITDKRHHGIICLINDEIEKRQFSDWSMGFKTTKYKEISKIDGLKDFNRNKLINKDDEITLTFLNAFLKSHRYEISY